MLNMFAMALLSMSLGFSFLKICYRIRICSEQCMLSCSVLLEQVMLRVSLQILGVQVWPA